MRLCLVRANVLLWLRRESLFSVKIAREPIQVPSLLPDKRNALSRGYDSMLLSEPHGVTTAVAVAAATSASARDAQRMSEVTHQEI